MKRSDPPSAVGEEAPLDIRALFETSIDHVCVAGFDGRFKRLSPSWSKTLGWSAEELMSRPSLEFVHPDDRVATLAGRERLTSGGELGPLVNRYVCKDGSFRWFEWRSVADLDRALVYCIARDVTEQKQAEAQLQAATKLQAELQRQLILADRMASVGTLAAGVAHEINNPLSFVVGNLSLILEAVERAATRGTSPSTQELAELASAAMTGAERIRKAVAALKTFSRSEEEQRVVLEVHPLLELSIEMTFNEIRHRARLVRDYGPVPLVEVDEARLGQVFINLLINAAQALPDGGATEHEIRVVTATDALGRAVIEVRDTGPGVPTHLANRIFDPFFTTKPIGIGTGLGLSISHAILASMGGTISLEDSAGRGAAFRVVLPPASAPKAQVAVPPVVAPSVAGAAVLVVDDEPAVGVLLRRVLTAHQVMAVTAAQEALALIDAGKPFDIIISDVMMPGMSGVELYEALAERFPEYKSRVIFISGGAFTPATKAFLERTGNPRIEKPFNPQRVRELVERVLTNASR
ncbi:MAG TPA: ATP-binding protein [Polyangiaceae bacterium]|nr:ATP-binding protein [Polyangiaceae bacterium]